MRRTFPFHDLGADEFETLAGAICFELLGIGAIVFSTGPDGGRDGKFVGSATKFPSAAAPLVGKFIVQSKHTSNPVASCSDSEFGRLLAGEHPKIVKLIAGGELDHYMIFTNRKKPADDAIEKEAGLIKLGLQTAHIIGSEQLRDWLTQHHSIWGNLGFDRFERKLHVQTEDITAVISAFHTALGDGSVALDRVEDFSYVPKPEKNRINRLSQAYFDEIRIRSLPYFGAIETFLKNPRNVDFKDMYEDTADEIRRKLITASPRFDSFDGALTFLIDAVTSNNAALQHRRRFATIFLHYMYYTCDIGQHAETVEAS